MNPMAKKVRRKLMMALEGETIKELKGSDILPFLKLKIEHWKLQNGYPPKALKMTKEVYCSFKSKLNRHLKDEGSTLDYGNIYGMRVAVI